MKILFYHEKINFEQYNSFYHRKIHIENIKIKIKHIFDPWDIKVDSSLIILKSSILSYKF
jgi:hypothetical protein